METGRKQSRKRLCLLHRVTYHTRARTETTWSASGCCHRCRHAPRHLEAFSFQVLSIWLVPECNGGQWQKTYIYIISHNNNNTNCKNQQVTIKCTCSSYCRLCWFCPSSLLFTQWSVQHFEILSDFLSFFIKSPLHHWQWCVISVSAVFPNSRPSHGITKGSRGVTSDTDRHMLERHWELSIYREKESDRETWSLSAQPRLVN